MSQHPKEIAQTGAGYTLITGSSQGIGRAMAEECARRGMPVILVALDNQHLHDTAAYLRTTYEVAVHILGIDLTEPAAPRQVWEWCQQQRFRVVHLINNAGFGRNGVFEQLPQEEYASMMRLNNHVMVELTHLFLPQLKQQPQARIMNMSSIEFVLPNPYKAVYAGTKNFVYGFSLALAEELRDFGVTVSILCPGPVLTNADGYKRIQSMGKSARLMVLRPEEVAPEAIGGMLGGKRVIIPGRVPAFIAWLAGLFPRDFKMWILGRMFSKYKEASEVPHEAASPTDAYVDRGSAKKSSIPHS